MSKVAVIGSPGSSDAFRALGAEVLASTNPDETERILDEIQENYAVIFITEDIAPERDILIRRNLERVLPALSLLPVASSQNSALDKLRYSVEKAVGADILGLGGEES